MTNIPSITDHEIAAQVREISARLRSTDARVNYVATLLKPMLPVADDEGRNAFYAASRLLGCTPAFARHIVGGVSRRGSAEAWRAWRADAGLGALPTFEVPTLPDNAVGIVYFASPAAASNVVKIGISTNLARHLRDLEDETGEAHALAHWFVGTTLDEAVAQFAAAGCRISGKWFETAKGGQIPGFIPRGVSQMRDLMGADLQKGRVA